MMVEVPMTFRAFSIGIFTATLLAATCHAQEQATGREDDEVATDVETLPVERGGQDLIGEEFGEPRFDAWTKNDPEASEPRRGQVTLYRWWTDTCPYCEASLPAVEGIRSASPKSTTTADLMKPPLAASNGRRPVDPSPRTTAAIREQRGPPVSVTRRIVQSAIRMPRVQGL